MIFLFPFLFFLSLSFVVKDILVRMWSQGTRSDYPTSEEQIAFSTLSLCNGKDFSTRNEGYNDLQGIERERERKEQ